MREKGKGKKEKRENGRGAPGSSTSTPGFPFPFSLFPLSTSHFPFPILLLSLLAFGLRTAYLAGPPLSGDEAFTVLLTDRGWAGMLAVMRITEPNPPLHFFALRAWMAVAGRSEFSVRFLSTLAGVLVVPLTYVLGHRLLGTWVSLAAALLAAVNPYLVWYSHFARAYSLLVALSLASLALAVRLWSRPTTNDQRPTVENRRGAVNPSLPRSFLRQGSRRAFVIAPRRIWWAYVAVTALALYTHYFAFLLLIAQNLIFLFGSWRSINRQFTIHSSQFSRTWRPWLVAQVAIVLLVTPWLLLTSPMLLHHEKAWLTYTSPAAGLWRALRAYSLGVDAHGALVLPVTLLFAIALTAGIIAMGRNNRWALVVLGTYLFAPVAIVLLGSLIRPIFLERYLIGIVPAFLVLVAAGIIPWQIADCEQEIRNPKSEIRNLPRDGLTLVALITLVASAFLAPPYGTDIADWRGVARALEVRVAANDVVVQNYPDPAFAYYYRGPAERTVLPAQVPIPRQTTDQALRALLREHDCLWLLPRRDPTWDADGFVESWLDRRAERVSDAWVAGHRLLAYRAPAEPVPDIEHRLGWQLGDMARLAGYQLDAERVAPGKSLELTLFWEPLRTTDVAYTVFVHLWDGQTIWGQKDGQPQACPEPCRRTGAWPTTNWFPGDLIVDSRAIPVDPEAPAGTYQLIAGLYQLNTGERLPTFDAEGRPRGDYVPVAEVHVEP